MASLVGGVGERGVARVSLGGGGDEDRLLRPHRLGERQGVVDAHPLPGVDPRRVVAHRGHHLDRVSLVAEQADHARPGSARDHPAAEDHVEHLLRRFGFEQTARHRLQPAHAHGRRLGAVLRGLSLLAQVPLADDHDGHGEGDEQEDRERGAVLVVELRGVVRDHEVVEGEEREAGREQRVEPSGDVGRGGDGEHVEQRRGRLRGAGDRGQRDRDGAEERDRRVEDVSADRPGATPPAGPGGRGPGRVSHLPARTRGGRSGR